MTWLLVIRKVDRFKTNASNKANRRRTFVYIGIFGPGMTKAMKQKLSGAFAVKLCKVGVVAEIR